MRAWKDFLERSHWRHRGTRPPPNLNSHYRSTRFHLPRCPFRKFAGRSGIRSPCLPRWDGALCRRGRACRARLINHQQSHQSYQAIVPESLLGLSPWGDRSGWDGTANATTRSLFIKKDTTFQVPRIMIGPGFGLLTRQAGAAVRIGRVSPLGKSAKGVSTAPDRISRWCSSLTRVAATPLPLAM